MAQVVTNPTLPPQGVPFAKIAASVRPRLSTYCSISTEYVYPVANDNYALNVDEDFFRAWWAVHESSPFVRSKMIKTTISPLTQDERDKAHPPIVEREGFATGESFRPTGDVLEE